MRGPITLLTGLQLACCAMPASAQAGDCAGLISVYERDAETMAKACRQGPQPPRYHSCNDMRVHVRIMSQSILRCPGLPPALRQLAEANLRSLSGAQSDPRGPSSDQARYYQCQAEIGVQCMAQCANDMQCNAACKGMNAWRCNR